MTEKACNFDQVPTEIHKLRALTEALPFANLVRHDPMATHIKELELEKGTSYMVGLYKTEKMAVSRVYSSAGCEFPAHAHSEWELLLVYKGELHLKFKDETVKLKEKEFYYVEPGIAHGGYYPEESWVLCITMPASPDFPDGG
jgi:quercetin dioxygenase-like cupin family protein